MVARKCLDYLLKPVSGSSDFLQGTGAGDDKNPKKTEPEKEIYKNGSKELGARRGSREPVKKVPAPKHLLKQNLKERSFGRTKVI